MNINFLHLLIIFIVVKIEAYRILGLFPLPFKSHSIFSQALMKGLAKKGHHVDVISYHQELKPPKNYQTILNLSNISYAHAIGKFNSIQEPLNRNRDIMSLAKFDYGLHICNLMSHKKMQVIIQNLSNNSRYDLFITQVSK